MSDGTTVTESYWEHRLLLVQEWEYTNQGKPVKENSTYPGIDADEVPENCDPYPEPYRT